MVKRLVRGGGGRVTSGGWEVRGERGGEEVGEVSTHGVFVCRNLAGSYCIYIYKHMRFFVISSNLF